MLPFRWGFLGVALLIAATHGASINSAESDDNVEYIDDVQRSKRSYKRGQTQSQYLNFGQPEQDGKAEAEATEGGSRSTVSGTHGMGQAQSQFSSGDCSGCGVGSAVYDYSTGSPDPLTLDGNAISYSDSKPSSIIRLHGATPSEAFGPAGSFSPGSGSQLGRPGGSFPPGSGATTGQLGQPGVSGGYAPGTDSSFTPGAGQTGRSGPDGAYTPGSSYTPGTAGSGILGRPGSPGGAYAPGTDGVGLIGKPGAYAPGGAYIPGVGGAAQIGRTGGDSSYAPGGAGQIGTPGAGSDYAPSSAFSPGGGGSGQIGRPGSSGDFAPGSVYGPSGSSGAQIGRLGASGTYSPASSGGGQSGAPGTSFGTSYVPAAGSGAIGQQGGPGFGKPGIAQQGQKHSQPPQLIAPPAALPGQAQEQPTGNAFRPQTPAYGHGTGEQMPVYSPGISYTIPGANQQQIPQYTPGGQQLPTYRMDSRQPEGGTSQPGLQTPSFGQPSSHYKPGSGFASGQQPVPQFNVDQPHVGYPQKTGYGPSYGGPATTGVAARPGTPYSVTGPQQILQQPGAGTITRPGPQGIHQGVNGLGQQTLNGLQPGYRVQPSVSYGQPGAGIQSGLEGGQPGASFGQPGVGIQQGRVSPSSGTIQPGSGLGQPGSAVQQGRLPSGGVVVQPGNGFSQPGYGQQTSAQPADGFVQPSGVQSGIDFVQPGAGDQFGRAQPNDGFVQPSTGGFIQPGAGFRQDVFQPGGISQSSGQTENGIQPGIMYGPPGAGNQPGTTLGKPGTVITQGSGIPDGQQGVIYRGAVFDQRGAGYQPRPASFGPQGIKPGTLAQQIPSGAQKQPSYASELGPQGVAIQSGTGGGYQQGMPYGLPEQGGMRPSGRFDQPSVGTQPRFQQPDRPNTGIQPITDFGQQIGGQHRPSQQVSVQSGGGYIPQTGGGVQQGVGARQGSSFGAGYESAYGQQPGAQPGGGYGLPTGGSQNVQPGIGLGQPSNTGVLLPGAGYGQPASSGLTQYGQSPQQIIQPGSSYIPSSVQPSGVQQGIAGSSGLAAGVGGAEDAFSQAESSIGNGQAAASAQGKKNGGTAKTQVQGTYSSSGSFSASAMTSDNDRSASSQVTGGVEGAMSQSQGQGGAAQSQAQVQLNEKTGGTKASSQSGGIIHQSQSEVQANDKGGLADAQSSGPGQTSSQAQIGFKPGQDGEIVQSTGGGQASAQSGVHYGNSQSQIQGTSKYGVSYHGAAQSASGTKEQVATYREQNKDLFNTISQFGGTDAVTDRVDTVYNPSLTSESDIPDLQLKASKTNKEVVNTNKLDDDSILPNEEEEEEPYDEYEDEEDYYNENPIKMESKNNGDKKLELSSLHRTHTQMSPTQTQQVAVGDSNKKYNVVQNQNGRVKIYPARTTTETVPNGFRGTVNVEKKFHTKSLETHKSENKLNITEGEKSEHSPRTPDSFVTVTKSITGSMDNTKNPPQDNKNFQSTYYTKSSTCGYFTFSCNIVYGANGRSKICRPKAPTNGKC